MKKHIAVLFLIGGAFILYIYVASFLSFSIPSLASSLIIRDTHDEEIGELIASESIRHREIEFSDIPTFYLSGTIYLEDRDFWENNGISFRGIARSIVHNLKAGKIVEGASTLSAQTVRNILWINERRDLKHKILESLYALRLNHMMSKQEILTLYVNRIGYGYLNYGLMSASLYYFGKEPKNLTRAEQIALLVLPKNPNNYDPYEHPKAFRERFETIVRVLEGGGIISARDGENIRVEKLNFITNHKPTLPYVVDFLKTKTKAHTGQISSILKTTIDNSLTTRIDTLAHLVLDDLSWRNVSDYGILIAEMTPSGPVLRVMIGGKDYHESLEGQVNTTISPRQPGSTLKPFTYLLAFEKLGFTPESTITDLPVAYKTAQGYSYEPKNYSQDYAGEVTLREALSQSINIPAIKLLEKIGTETLLSFLRSVGMTSLRESSDHYGLALTLGDGEVTLFELLQGYSIFAYDGLFCEISYIEDFNSSCVRKADKKYTDMVVSILSDRYAKLPGFPLNSSLDFADRWVALKTGTSRNFRDNWTVGFTKRYMIGVWTGNKNGENMKGVSGATGAGEIFARIVYALDSTETTPKILERNKISEEFLEITSPLEGSLYQREDSRGIDLQKIALKFQTNISHERFYWIVDGEPTVESSLEITPGMHTVEIILEKEGIELMRRKSSFEVRE